MELTPDSFCALARSSPWRWRVLHFRHRDDMRPESVEAWIVRPGWMLVRDPERGDVVETGVPHTASWVSTDPDFVPPEPKTPQEVEPRLRPDGLVVERPTDPAIEYDDPLYGNYTWVAMLDPQELSHHVSVTGLISSDRHGRETWWATVCALEGYEARCPDCCDLLLGGADRGLEHLVGLDVETGVLVSLSAPECRDRDWFIENEILGVDDEVAVPLSPP